MTKEARIIKKLDNCDNIVKCLGVSYGPLAMMLELSCFNFAPFGASYKNQIAYSLDDYLKVCDAFSFHGFEHTITQIARQVAHGIQHMQLGSYNILLLI